MGSLAACETAAAYSASVRRSSRRLPLDVFVITEVRLYRDGLSQLLATKRSLHIVGAAPPDEHSIAQIAALKPRIVLVDSAAVRYTPIVQRIAAATPSSSIIAFALSDEHTEILACAKAGVTGYIAREASLDELVAVVTQLDSGDLACSPRIAALMFRHATAIARQNDVASPTSLTTREREILTLVDRGMSNKEIAVTLSIELTTVKNHVHHILDKLRVTCRGAAAAKARTADPLL